MVIIAGPCAVENYPSLYETAKAVKQAGAEALRGGAFKPRTSPYTFQGLGEEGLKHLRDVSDKLNLPIVTEVMDTRMWNWWCAMPMSCRWKPGICRILICSKKWGEPRSRLSLNGDYRLMIKEWLMSAEYIMAGGEYGGYPRRARYPHL